MNQSAEPTLWPLTSVCVSDGAVPRMLTRFASAKAPSPPELELMLTPGRRCTVSATFLAGSLPTSSAVTTSTTESALFLLLSEEAYDARRPLISTVWVPSTAAGAADAAGWGAGAACCAQAGVIAPDISSAADAKGFKRKDMAASEGGYRCSGSASVRVDGIGEPADMSVTGSMVLSAAV